MAGQTARRGCRKGRWSLSRLRKEVWGKDGTGPVAAIYHYGEPRIERNPVKNRPLVGCQCIERRFCALVLPVCPSGFFEQFFHLSLLGLHERGAIRVEQLDPVVSSGLWDAVIMHPAFAVRALYATEGVGAIPVKRACPPAPMMPAMMVRASRGLVVRVSVPTTQSGNRSPRIAPTASAVSTSVRSNRMRIPDDPKSMHDGGCFL